jgi:hypothetical protein
LYELVFHVGIAKQLSPGLEAFKAELHATNLTKAQKNKKIAAKKIELEKETTRIVQQRFQSPEGGGLRCFIPEPQKGGNSNTGVCANRWTVVYRVLCHDPYIPRFFLKSGATADILQLPERGIVAIWEMLRLLNSTHKLIDVPAFRQLARTVFDFYKEDMQPYKRMTANMHMLVAHIPDWVE